MDFSYRSKIIATLSFSSRMVGHKPHMYLTSHYRQKKKANLYSQQQTEHSNWAKQNFWSAVKRRRIYAIALIVGTRINFNQNNERSHYRYAKSNLNSSLQYITTKPPPLDCCFTCYIVVNRLRSLHHCHRRQLMASILHSGWFDSCDVVNQSHVVI